MKNDREPSTDVEILRTRLPCKVPVACLAVCGNSININEDTCISRFEKYLPLDEHLNEYFMFLPETAFLYEVQELFKYTPVRKKLLTVIYITKTGKRDEPLIGMVTPWDLL